MADPHKLDSQLWKPFLGANESYITFWRGIPPPHRNWIFLTQTNTSSPPRFAQRSTYNEEYIVSRRYEGNHVVGLAHTKSSPKIQCSQTTIGSHPLTLQINPNICLSYNTLNILQANQSHENQDWPQMYNVHPTKVTPVSSCPVPGQGFLVDLKMTFWRGLKQGNFLGNRVLRI